MYITNSETFNMELNENNSATTNEMVHNLPNKSLKVRRAQPPRGESETVPITENKKTSNINTQNQNNQNQNNQNQNNQNQNNQNQKNKNQNKQNQKNQNQNKQNQKNQNQNKQNQKNQNQNKQNQNNQNQKSQNQNTQNQKPQNQKSQNQKKPYPSDSQNKANNQNQNQPPNNGGKQRNSKGDRNKIPIVIIDIERQYNSNTETSETSKTISNEATNYYNSIPQETIQSVDNQGTFDDATITRETNNINNNNNNINYVTIGNKNNNQRNPLTTGVIVILGIYAFVMLSIGFYIHKKRSNSKKMEAKKEEDTLDVMNTYKYVTDDDYPYPIINKHLKNVICTTYEAPSCPPPKDAYKNISDASIHIKSPLGDPNNVITGESDTSIISSLNDTNNIITNEISVPEKAAVSNVESNVTINC